MCEPSKPIRQLRRLKRERRNLEYGLMNQAMIWFDVRGSQLESERAKMLEDAALALRKKTREINRFEIENQI